MSTPSGGNGVLEQHFMSLDYGGLSALAKDLVKQIEKCPLPELVLQLEKLKNYLDVHAPGWTAVALNLVTSQLDYLPLIGFAVALYHYLNGDSQAARVSTARCCNSTIVFGGLSAAICVPGGALAASALGALGNGLGHVAEATIAKYAISDAKTREKMAQFDLETIAGSMTTGAVCGSVAKHLPKISTEDMGQAVRSCAALAFLSSTPQVIYLGNKEARAYLGLKIYMLKVKVAILKHKSEEFVQNLSQTEGKGMSAEEVQTSKRQFDDMQADLRQTKADLEATERNAEIAEQLFKKCFAALETVAATGQLPACVVRPKSE
ncbi:hypothetical protein BV898_07403 [Hypsibius exemplaris]|uniref:Uncharacterized protein n=1 Tax=Hypsibius exemplaris TaxID=2072580 RepID=A0A1W0WTV1_HYPEX|nr:hypothetical protein BV898_07403 [Hypsibius exemplaris]